MIVSLLYLLRKLKPHDMCSLNLFLSLSKYICTCVQLWWVCFHNILPYHPSAQNQKKRRTDCVVSSQFGWWEFRKTKQSCHRHLWQISYMYEQSKTKGWFKCHPIDSIKWLFFFLITQYSIWLWINTQRHIQTHTHIYLLFTCQYHLCIS